MALTWTDRVDGDDFVLAADVNSLAAAIIDNEADIATNASSISDLNADVDFNVTNLTSGDFASTTGWTGYGATIAVANNVLSITGTGTVNAPAARAQNVIAYESGKKLYVRGLVKVTNSNCVRIELEAIATGMTTISQTLVTSPAADTEYPFSVVVPLGSGGSGNVEIRISHRYADVSTANGKVLQLRKIVTSDLTTRFISPNEPTAAQMDAILAFYTNSWFNGTVNLAANPKMLPYLLNSLRNLNLEKTGYGVVGTSDLLVAAQSTPDMTVKVPTGVIYMDTGRRFTPTAVTAQAVTAADATNPRIDIVYVNSSGAIAYLAGTAAASPSAPSVPTGGQKLAEISVAANATTIVTANIADMRKTLTATPYIFPTLLNGWTGTLRYKKLSSNLVVVDGYLTAGTLTYATFICNFASGYRIVSGKILPVMGFKASVGNINFAFLDGTNNCVLRVSQNTGLSAGDSVYVNFVFYAEA